MPPNGEIRRRYLHGICMGLGLMQDGICMGLGPGLGDFHICLALQGTNLDWAEFVT